MVGGTVKKYKQLLSLSDAFDDDFLKLQSGKY